MFAFGMTPEEYEAHMEEHRLNAEAHRHDMHEWVESMDAQGLRMLRALLFNYDEHPSASYLSGIAAAMLYHKFNICPACGKDHAELDPSVLLGKESSHEGLVYDNPGSGTPMGTDYQPSFEKMSGEELLANVPAEEQQLMDEYGLDFIEYQYPSVRCSNCTKPYVSLKDRMVKEPGVKGCDGCQQKAMFG